jgi:hypothetical protein
MPRWAAILIIGSLAVCVACGALVYVLWHRTTTVVANEMASVVATQVTGSIRQQDLAIGTIVLTEDDLDVNTVIALDDSCGFNVINSDAEIYGVVTEITPAGITLGCAGATYSAVPVVADGRVQLSEMESSNELMRFVISKDKLKDGVEKGINGALEAEGLTPTGLTLQNGSITITTTGAHR